MRSLRVLCVFCGELPAGGIHRGDGVIGATDVAYLGWDRKLHAPPEIFPH